MLQKIVHVSQGKKSDFFQIRCTSLINIWNVRVNTFFFTCFVYNDGRHSENSYHLCSVLTVQLCGFHETHTKKSYIMHLVLTVQRCGSRVIFFQHGRAATFLLE